MNSRLYLPTMMIWIRVVLCSFLLNIFLEPAVLFTRLSAVILENQSAAVKLPVTLLSLNASEFSRNIKPDQKEFKWNGNLYDIRSIQLQSDGTYLLTVYCDTEETGLMAVLKEWMGQSGENGTLPGSHPRKLSFSPETDLLSASLMASFIIRYHQALFKDIRIELRERSTPPDVPPPCCS